MDSDAQNLSRIAHERLLAALKASRCGTWRWDIAADRVEWDAALCQVYGLPEAAAPRSSQDFLALVHPDDRERVLGVLGVCLEGGTEVEYEFRALVGQREVWIYDRSTLARDAAGRPLSMTGACLDVTERKRVEQERDAALEKHKWLLVELNHRVKNHLQMITAMLSLQAATVGAGLAAEFEQAIRRIETIADLHSRLYQGDSQEAVEVGAYLADICAGLRRSLLDGTRIALECWTAPATLTLDQAVPLGLLVNELVTNAIKHAFPAGRGGKITVHFAQEGGRALLSVGDDGRGQPSGGGEQGFGTRLVAALARQLNASIALDESEGRQYRVSFPT